MLSRQWCLNGRVLPVLRYIEMGFGGIAESRDEGNSPNRESQMAWSCGCGVVWCGVGVLVYMMRVTNEDSRDEINKCADDYYGSLITFLVPRCLARYRMYRALPGAAK